MYLVLYWGAKYTGCVALITNSVGETLGALPTPAVEGIGQSSCELRLARAPGDCLVPAHRTYLVHRCLGFVECMRPFIVAARHFTMCVCVTLACL